MVAVVDDAEMEKHSAIVTGWLHRLQDVLYQADDLLDELQMLSSRNPNQVSSSAASLSRRFINNTFPPKSKLAPALQHIFKVLYELIKESIQVGFPTDINVKSAGVPRRPAPSLDIGSYGPPKQVVGRGSDEKAVIDLILESYHRVAVVPIVGCSFIGKTTLAGLIYSNRSLYGKFDFRLWLSLRDGDDMLDFLQILGLQLFEDYRLYRSHDEDIKLMKMEIQKLLENKRLLVVLDDFKDSNLHNSLARELMDMLPEGSVIILTTRSRRAASLIGTTPAYQIQPLSPHDSFELLAWYAFTRDRQENPEYEWVAWEFLQSCGGVPLLLRMIGSQLFYKDTPEEWRSYLEDVRDQGFAVADIREYTCFADDMPGLPSHLKFPLQCCRLKNACGLSVEALTCVWMALGFLSSDCDATTPQAPPEYTARKYLNEFVESPLCPDVEYAPGGVLRNVNFNDALCDFAAATPLQKSRVVTRDRKMFDITTMYIVWDQDYLGSPSPLPSDHILDRNKVRLFMVSTGQRVSLKFVRDVVSCLVRLRVLGLGGCNVDMLPESIGELKHLRYLDVARNPMLESLPDSICNLWYLQTLFLHGCSQLKDLPANIGRLQNLRYLTLTVLRENLPDAIGHLTSLHTFGLSSCPRLSSLPSNIKNLKNLETLAIVNCPEMDLASTSSVEGFKGLVAIQTLLLSHLPKFANMPSLSDLGNPSVALKHLQILSCKSLTETKWITQFRFLRSLTIEACPILLDIALTDGASQLNGLLELVIRSCPRLDNTEWIRQFVSLRSLIIGGCPKLVDLNDGFCELKNLDRLEIRGCPALTKWFASPEGKDWRRIAHVQVIEVDGARLEP